MLKVDKLLPHGTPLAAALRRRARKLVLPYADRQRSRLRLTLDDGTEIGVVLSRQSSMRAGAVLVDEQGGLIEVSAAPEAVYRVQARQGAADPAAALMRAAYHLGNRHIPVELGLNALKIEPDPVLRDLLQRLDMQVVDVVEPFEPEPGAYGGGHRHDHDEAGGSVGEQLSREAHAHRHDHEHRHDHHDHDHRHDHGHDHHHTAKKAPRFPPVPRR